MDYAALLLGTCVIGAALNELTHAETKRGRTDWATVTFLAIVVALIAEFFVVSTH